MSKRGWSKVPRSETISGPNAAPQTPGIHVYLFWTKEGEKYLSHTCEDITAEDLCILAAETVGITPLCHVLFALYNPQTCCWYSPNHVFSPKDNSNVVLHYCMRFYFRNWHGLNDKEPTVSRYTLRSETAQAGSPLLEITSLEYLFAQAKHEFVTEGIEMEKIVTEEELSRFKNESLGMAVLHLSHLAIERGSTLQEVAGKINFLHCIPRSFAKHISRDSFLTKIRIRRVFTEFVRTFQQHTVDKGQLGTQEIMYKYISTLENLVPRFGTETFHATYLSLRDAGSSSYSNIVHDEGVSKDECKAPATHEILVSGTKGIQWRKVHVQKAEANPYHRNDYLNYTRKPKRQLSQPNDSTPNEWTSFSDFPEITHIAISDANVCISTQDNRCMEVHMNSSQEARSFISLLDGYYRLTADAHHYLCREVAPPRVVLSEANLLHGPMHDDFVLHKLKKEAAEEGTFLVRWSALDYHRVILAVLNKNGNDAAPSHKQFRIQQRGSMFCMEGWDQQFSSVKGLTDNLKTFVLKSGSDSFTVKKCCFPRQAEISNLLVKRQGVDSCAHSDPVTPNQPHVHFYPIKDKDIVQEEHLGRGTITNIYSGRLQLRGGEDDDDEFNNNFANRKSIRVVLKILDQSHTDFALAFFETASLMSQVSHSHLVFVHGVSIKGSENIMVEEYVEFGPLDVFLHKEKASVNGLWKLIVALQLASALNYLETKSLVHGNVCAKNILVARRGLEYGTTPFVKLSDPGIALNVLPREERLARIPWIAPECIDNGTPIGNVADKWSFGVTLLEICNNGDLPMSAATLSEKERFYQQKGRLAEPSSLELAKFISMCVTYEPEERPCFRTVLRELTDLIKISQSLLAHLNLCISFPPVSVHLVKQIYIYFFNTDPEMPPSENLQQPDPSMFHKRYLKKMRVLGEGHFGKVTLYLYDPTNDNTGELVAVKTLKQECDTVPEGFLKEISILKSLYHSNIVKYKGCCNESGRGEVELIMEYVPLGSLRDYLPRHKVGVPQCLKFAQQICQGMEYLQLKRYVHRDLAARNVLVENDNLVKIGDFGLTKYIPEGEIYYRVREDGDSPVYWYAIECLKEYKFSFASDVWSFGVTLYEILTTCNKHQSPPFKYAEMILPTEGQMTTLLLIKLLEKNQRLPCPRDCPHEVKLLMEQCWDADPAKRPSFKELIEKLEAIRKTYDWQFNTNFSMSQIC
ncbi:non-receptor tyrosine-protein kinase TYK2 isoform 1-T1 [Odontesthes bonariensis]|uniref:non-receptor tyrosine-protein kinase TYK2 isoform X1 n=1 Tax=Odontesthes bonariensis TaxID=219752 RepID=UPI003F58149B